MVKKFIKTNDNFVWSLAVIAVVLLFLYLGANREGFQNMPTPPISSGSTIMPSARVMPSIPAMPPMPSMSSISTMPPMPSGSTIMPSTRPMTSSQAITPSGTMPIAASSPRPSIATVRAKVNELKTMVDNM